MPHVQSTECCQILMFIVLQNETWNLLNILVHPYTRPELGSGKLQKLVFWANDMMVSIGLFKKILNIENWCSSQLSCLILWEVIVLPL